MGVGELRTEKSVKKKWIDLTSRTKKTEAERWREMSATGRGECSLKTANDTKLKIIHLMGTEVIEGILPGMVFWATAARAACYEMIGVQCLSDSWSLH